MKNNTRNRISKSVCKQRIRTNQLTEVHYKSFVRSTTWPLTSSSLKQTSYELSFPSKTKNFLYFMSDYRLLHIEFRKKKHPDEP